MSPVSYATTSRLCNTEELIFIDLPWVSSLGKVNPSDGDWYPEPEHIEEIASLPLCLLYIQTFQESSGGIPPRIPCFGDRAIPPRSQIVYEIT